MTESETLTQIQVHLARIEGAVTTTLAHHDERIAALEKGLAVAATDRQQLRSSIGEVARDQIVSAQKISVVAEAQSGQLGRAIQITTFVIAVCSALMAIADRLLIR